MNNDCLWLMINNHLEGEDMKVGFDGSIKLEFHGAKVTSDGGLLAYRDLENFEMIGITQGEVKDINGILEKEGIAWPQIHQDKNNDKIIKLYNVRTYPTTILIDPEGIIIAKNLRGQSLEKKLEEIFG